MINSYTLEIGNYQIRVSPWKNCTVYRNGYAYEPLLKGGIVRPNNIAQAINLVLMGNK